MRAARRSNAPREGGEDISVKSYRRGADVERGGHAAARRPAYCAAQDQDGPPWMGKRFSIHRFITPSSRGVHVPDIPPPTHSEVRRAEENSNAGQYADEQAKRGKKEEEEERQKALIVESRRIASETRQGR